MICERMLREREAELREEYERILHTKLADQYEQFVKFTYDQLHRGYSSAEPPSCKYSQLCIPSQVFIITIIIRVYYY